MFGCIPVQYPSSQYLPFQEVVPWEECAVFVEDIKELPGLLRGMDESEIERRSEYLFFFEEEEEEGQGESGGVECMWMGALQARVKNMKV